MGASLAGFSGPIGNAGPQGAQGAAGETGAQGPTLIGPAGPAGSNGPAGEQGETGATGAQGSSTAGVAGATGYSGPTGAQGATGATGAQGPAGVVGHWTAYREFWFEYNSADVRDTQTGTVAEIAAYLKANPSLQVGIDGSMDMRGTDPRNQDLSDRRVSSIRHALLDAGVPADRIQTGAYGDENQRRDRRVAILISTAG
jgi:outer membrane protein OmpA-like peptidoglycan-associated protein